MKKVKCAAFLTNTAKGGVMDTSETYIGMRLAAIPDLGLGAGDIEAIKEERRVIHKISESPPNRIFVDDRGNFIFTHTEDLSIVTLCQLERQDQLQAMVRTKNKNDCFYLLSDFTEFVRVYKKDWDTSMEQLWLAFVMKENRSKVWTGEKWEKV